MTTFNIKAMVLALGFAFSAGAIAQSISKDEYKTDKNKISAEYKSAKARCGALSDNAKDICVAEAKGTEKVAKAELEASYKPTVKNHYKVRVAKAEADYGVANERCDDKSGNVKDVCIKEAKAAEISAKADAETQLKTTDANAKAMEKTSDARVEANAKVTEVRKDASAEKKDAAYKVAKEKCDTYSGLAKDTCQSQAAARFGKS